MKRNSLIRIVVTLFFISLLFFSFRKDMPEVLHILRETQPLYFFSGVFLQLIMVGVLSARLKLIFNGQGLLLPFKEALGLSFLGFFFNNFLPTAAGGDLPKAYFAYKKTKRKMESFACVVGDRFIGLFSLVILAALALFGMWGEVTEAIKMTVGLLFFFSCFSVAFLFNYPLAKAIKFFFTPLSRLGWDKKIEELYRFLHAMSKNRRLLFQTLFLSVMSQSLLVISVFIFIHGLSRSESFMRLFIVVPLVIVVSMFPSLNGLGIREGAFVYFFGGRIGNESAFALSILWLAMLGIHSVIGGLYYFFSEWRQIPLAELKQIRS